MGQILTVLSKSSKDAVVRVWDRETLELHRSMRGHEGPVNAVGLQNGRVVRPYSLSILTFEAHQTRRSAQAEMGR